MSYALSMVTSTPPIFSNVSPSASIPSSSTTAHTVASNVASSSYSAPQMSRTSSPLLVAPAPRRPIPLVARNRRERERDREREREREKYGHPSSSSSSSSSSSTTTFSSRPGPYHFPTAVNTLGGELRRSSLSSISGGIRSRSSSRIARTGGAVGAGASTIAALNASVELAKVAALDDEDLDVDIDDPMAQEDGEAAAELLHRGVSRLLLEHRPRQLSLSSALDGMARFPSGLAVPLTKDEEQGYTPTTPTEGHANFPPAGISETGLAASLLDPDLTPTKARLREMKKVLSKTDPRTSNDDDDGGGGGEGDADVDVDVDVDTRRLSANLRAQEESGRLSPTPSQSSRRTSLAVVPPLININELEELSPSTLTLPVGIPCSPAAASGLGTAAVDPTRHDPPQGFTVIPSSPISRTHTRNPFGKNSSRSMRDVEDHHSQEGIGSLNWCSATEMVRKEFEKVDME